MPDPITRSSQTVDMSSRFAETHAIVGSPAANAETTIASLTLSVDEVVTEGIFLEAWAAFTVGTSGTAVNMKIHHTNASGATIAATGAITATATNLMTLSAQGIDAVPTLPGQIYIVTLTVTGGAATSTVSAVSLFATIV